MHRSGHVRRKETEMAVTANPEYGRFMEEIVRKLVERYAEYENVKDTIVYKLVNTEKNRDILDDSPHREFMDLSAVYCICFILPDGRTGSVAVNGRLAEKWGVTEEELWNLAHANTQRIFPAKVRNLQDVIQPLWEKSLQTTDLGKIMAAVTNEEYWYGAGVVFYDDVLSRLTDMLGDRLFLIPSSVHEFFVFSDDGILDPGFFSDLAKRINESRLPDKEYLSDHVYRYEKGGGITIAG